MQVVVAEPVSGGSRKKNQKRANDTIRKRIHLRIFELTQPGQMFEGVNQHMYIIEYYSSTYPAFFAKSTPTCINLCRSSELAAVAAKLSIFTTASVT